MASQRLLDDTYAQIERAAINGERCPTAQRAGIPGLKASAVTALCRAGRIRVEVYAKNWRTATILTGPHAGKSTKPCPTRHAKPYLIVGTETRRLGHGGTIGADVSSNRPQPSAPRTLSRAEIEG